jgi:predicted kinase
VDATNVLATARRPLLRRASDAGVPATAIVLDLPAATILRRNSERATRVVDPVVVERHLVAVRATLDGDRLVREGFAHVVVLRSLVELDTVVVMRR